MDESKPPREPPRESWREHAYQAGIVTVNALTGGAGGTLLSMIVSSPLSRRRQEFEAEVSAWINELEQQGRLHCDKLAEHDQFISTYVEATLAAVRTHEREKLESLRNAVVNSALGDSPDDSLQQVFISLVAAFTSWHLRLLKFFSDPKGAYVAAGMKARDLTLAGSLPIELVRLYPDLKSRDEFVELIINDLNAERLAEIPRYQLSGGDETVYAKRTTRLGNKFLQFIAEPSV